MTNCYIWDTAAKEFRESDGDSAYLDSPRAGGKYQITGTAAAIRANLTPMGKGLLTTWLCNQRRSGTECPIVTADIINAAHTFRPLTTGERIERALLYFNDNVRVGEVIEISVDSDRNQVTKFILMAQTESLDEDELIAFLKTMQQMTLLDDMTEAIANFLFTPTASGWLKIDELNTRLPSSSQAFVAMWFSDTTNAAYAEGIEPAINDCGYHAMRIDRKEHSNKIDDEMIAEIRRSKFLVADLTCEKEKVRGSVYYEAGFAQGLGIPVIWTVARDSYGDIHFDTRQYNHIIWDTPAELRSLLAARIGAVLGDGPLKRGADLRG